MIRSALTILMRASDSASLAHPARRSLSTAIGQVPLNQKDAKKWLQFVCTHKECKQENEQDKVVGKFISALAYEKGVVLVRCPCDKLHLIADRLGWFQDGGIDIEKIAEEQGIKLDKGVVEYNPEAKQTPSPPKQS